MRSKDVNRKWYLVDANNQVLGRLASRVATILRGKHKPGFTPHMDCGDSVIVINADKIRLTGQKTEQKAYVSYSGYPGGQRKISVEDITKKHPAFPVEHAIKGMLPNNRLGRQLFRNLHVYAGESHPHQAQNPEKLKLQ